MIYEVVIPILTLLLVLISGTILIMLATRHNAWPFAVTYWVVVFIRYILELVLKIGGMK